MDGMGGGWLSSSSGRRTTGFVVPARGLEVDGSKGDVGSCGVCFTPRNTAVKRRL